MAMLDRIPFGSTGRIVGDGYGQGKGVGQSGLELGFPGVTAATVAAADISQNEQLVGIAIAGGTFLVPPMSDGMSGKGGSVVGNADHQSTAIFHNIVNPIRNSDPNRIGAEVVIIDATRGRFPTVARIFEIAESHGVFAGLSLEGATLRQDQDENAKLYGKPLTNEEILTGTVKRPATAGPFLAQLQHFSGKEVPPVLFPLRVNSR
jgi:hypothetical protein